jgi:hypothetical protein
MLRLFTPLSPHVSEAEHDFFNAHDDSGGSLAPTEVDSYETFSDEQDLAPLSPELLKRRARLRRIVSGVVGVASVVSIFATARLVGARTHDSTSSSGVLSAQASLASIDVGHERPSFTPPAQQANAPAESNAVAAGAPAVQAAAGEAEADAVSRERTKAVDPAKTKKMILSAISHGQFGEAASLARAAIALDPADAENYLLLGSALQEMGQWERATEVFADCARRAKRGPRGECRALSRQ